jgi:hypothetical protein
MNRPDLSPEDCASVERIQAALRRELDTAPPMVGRVWAEWLEAIGALTSPSIHPLPVSRAAK